MLVVAKSAACSCPVCAEDARKVVERLVVPHGVAGRPRTHPHPHPPPRLHLATWHHVGGNARNGCSEDVCAEGGGPRAFTLRGTHAADVAHFWCWVSTRAPPLTMGPVTCAHSSLSFRAFCGGLGWGGCKASEFHVTRGLLDQRPRFGGARGVTRQVPRSSTEYMRWPTSGLRRGQTYLKVKL